MSPTVRTVVFSSANNTESHTDDRWLASPCLSLDFSRTCKRTKRVLQLALFNQTLKMSQNVISFPPMFLEIYLNLIANFFRKTVNKVGYKINQNINNNKTTNINSNRHREYLEV